MRVVKIVKGCEEDLETMRNENPGNESIRGILTIGDVSIRPGK